MQDKPFNYREVLIGLCTCLRFSCAELLVMGYNVLMHREMNDVFEPFEDGDHIPSDIALLESSENYKIRILVRSLRAMDAALGSFININLLDTEMLEHHFQEGTYSEHWPYPGEPDHQNEEQALEQCYIFHCCILNSLFIYAYLLSHEAMEFPQEIDFNPFDENFASAAPLNRDDQNAVRLLELMDVVWKGIYDFTADEDMVEGDEKD